MLQREPQLLIQLIYKVPKFLSDLWCLSSWKPFHWFQELCEMFYLRVQEAAHSGGAHQIVSVSHTTLSSYFLYTSLSRVCSDLPRGKRLFLPQGVPSFSSLWAPFHFFPYRNPPEFSWLVHVFLWNLYGNLLKLASEMWVVH